MCWCTPNIRTPWCGNEWCKPPNIEQPKSVPLFANDQLVRHIKSGGIYKIIAVNAKMENDSSYVVVYRSQYSGEVWVRPLSEFQDKFEEITF